jgi:hypothetical protein
MPMPENLKPTWEALYKEVINVHARWIIFRQLFAEPGERIAILNESAGTFFYYMQSILVDNVQLTLSKLADPAETRGYPNATLALLAERIAESNEQPLIDKLNEALTEYKASCEQIKTRRNKQLAHYDQATLLQPLPGPTRKEIEDALAALRRFMEPAERYLTSESTSYQEVILGSAGDALIFALRRGLRYQELQRNGTIPWDDIKKLKLPNLSG